MIVEVTILLEEYKHMNSKAMYMSTQGAVDQGGAMLYYSRLPR